MDLALEGRVAIVTGGGGAIGSAICQRLAEEGAKPVIVDIDVARAEAHAAAIKGTGGEALAVAADITNTDSVKELVEKAEATFGKVDILVNNAGFQRDKRIVNMPEEDWDAVVDVVLRGAFVCSKAVIPGMAERKWGRIINMSSRAHLGNPGQANYSAAKAGLLGFSRALALENGKYGITVNSVAPGIVDTPAVRALAHFDKIRENANKTTPIGRMGTVQDVADAVAFLASERASYISGDVLHITGGRY